MTKREAEQIIARELAAGETARLEGNAGRMRVCARRAAGAALAYWLTDNPRPDWSPDAMRRLVDVQREAELPDDIRAASARLTTRISPDFTVPFSNDPLEDAALLVSYFLGGPPSS